MNSIIKIQLAFFTLFFLYILSRIFIASNQNLTIFEQIFYGNVLKNSLGILVIFLAYLAVFIALKKNPPTGPTIISAKKLKIWLYLSLLFIWLGIIIHLLFDSLKILLPLNLFQFFHLADFIDETVSHVANFLSIIFISFIGLFLEIQRPSLKKITSKEITILVIFALIAGIFWGLNLTEGRLSTYTSLPAMLSYLFLSLYLFSARRLSFLKRPWSLSYFILYLFSSLTYISYGLYFKSFPEFFYFFK